MAFPSLALSRSGFGGRQRYHCPLSQFWTGSRKTLDLFYYLVTYHRDRYGKCPVTRRVFKLAFLGDEFQFSFSISQFRTGELYFDHPIVERGFSSRYVQFGWD